MFRQPSNFTNGNTRDRQGRLISCEQGTRRVTRTEYDGSITTLAEKFDGKPLNSPNGVIVKSDDTVWFTDPSYGIGGDHEGNRGEAELPRNVYRLDPKSGKMDVVVGDFSMPNGLCFSPDEKKFYVTDTGELGGAFKQTLIRVYDVDENGKLSNGRLLHDFKDVPQPYIADDIRVDEDGNIWAAGGWSPNHAMNGVRVFAPDGTPLGAIVVPEVAANLCFGGHHHNRLFICAHLGLCDGRRHAWRRAVTPAKSHRVAKRSRDEGTRRRPWIAASLRLTLGPRGVRSTRRARCFAAFRLARTYPARESPIRADRGGAGRP